MPLQILTGPTISAGQSLSSGLDCSVGSILKIAMPAAWTNADLTFQTSPDGIAYNDASLPNGQPVVFSAQPGTTISGIKLLVGWLKIRSGTKDRPVVQPADRIFTIAIDTNP
jgi:hypothetical protein